MLLLLLAAVKDDLKSERISNRLILTGLSVGLIYRLGTEGAFGILIFLFHTGIPVILFFLLFLMRALGAGDIKLFSLISSIFDCRELAYCVAASFLIGAFMSLCKMLYHKTLYVRLLYFASYIVELCASRRFQQYSYGVREPENTIHFSIAILLGYLISLGACH